MMEVAGVDATSAYEDVGHSEDAREIMHPMLVGVLQGATETGHPEQKKPEVHIVKRGASKPQTKNALLTPQVEVAALAVGAAAVVWFVRATHLLPSPTGLHMPHGGFTTGFLLAGASSAALALIAYRYLNNAMQFGGEYTRFPSHMPVAKTVASTNRPAGVLIPQVRQCPDENEYMLTRRRSIRSFHWCGKTNCRKT